MERTLAVICDKRVEDDAVRTVTYSLFKDLLQLFDKSL